MGTITLTASRGYQDIGTVGQNVQQLAGNIQSINQILDVGLRNTRDYLNGWIRVSDLIGLGIVTLINGNQLQYTPPSGGSSLTASESVAITAGNITLVGDTATPSASYYYGTNSGGTRGWYALPSSGTGTVTSVGVSSTTLTLAGTNPVTTSGTISVDLSSTQVTNIGLGGSSLQAANVADSITTSGGNLQLVGDASAPGNSFFYGTNGSGTKGWYALPAGVSGANPTASVGLSAVNGLATTYLRSDGAPALDVTISPTWSGNHTWMATSGTAVTVEGYTSAYGVDVYGVPTANDSYGLRVSAGTSASDHCFTLYNYARSLTFLDVLGNGAISTVGDWTFAPASSNPTIWSKNAATLPAPKAGTLLQVAEADGTQTRILVDGFGAVPNLNFRRADTTAAAPSAVQLNESLGQISWFGYGATGYGSAGRAVISANASQNWTDTAQGSYLIFETTPNGSTSQATVWTVDQDGGLWATGATGGDKGAGTVNATGLFVNGAAVLSPGAIQNMESALWNSTNGAVQIALAVPQDILIPYACTLRELDILTQGGTGSCTVTILRAASSAGAIANLPPAVDITNGNAPAIASGTLHTDTTFTGWTTTTFTQNDVLRLTLTANTVFSSVKVILRMY